MALLHSVCSKFSLFTLKVSVPLSRTGLYESLPLTYQELPIIELVIVHLHNLPVMVVEFQRVVGGRVDSIRGHNVDRRL